LTDGVSALVAALLFYRAGQLPLGYAQALHALDLTAFELNQLPSQLLGAHFDKARL
jgi:hypothetical protein